MKEFLRKLNVGYRVALYSTLIIALMMIVCIFCYFNGLSELPNGIALGGLVGILSYLFVGLTDNPNKKGMAAAVIITVLRFVLIIGALFLSGWLYYKMNYHIFNIFAVLGGYFVSLIVFIVVLAFGKEKDGSVQ